ncbi:hypothetical protein CHS0354_025060 [Potamilus streckersoni]|uniref:Uncharacterized protein n=1 Tax=Potamilus streckersoni TaxID=2493646 RepID=A0AAE0T8Z5_9BIVA|nr:hypothetical protein CHS0354_025060 [Potamilus streckersoni]
MQSFKITTEVDIELVGINVDNNKDMDVCFYQTKRSTKNKNKSSMKKNNNFLIHLQNHNKSTCHLISKKKTIQVLTRMPLAVV